MLLWCGYDELVLFSVSMMVLVKFCGFCCSWVCIGWVCVVLWVLFS